VLKLVLNSVLKCFQHLVGSAPAFHAASGQSDGSDFPPATRTPRCREGSRINLPGRHRKGRSRPNQPQQGEHSEQTQNQENDNNVNVNDKVNGKHKTIRRAARGDRSRRTSVSAIRRAAGWHAPRAIARFPCAAVRWSCDGRPSKGSAWHPVDGARACRRCAFQREARRCV
jgi:hypothetical protein